MRRPLVSVLTPTIPGREHLLAECRMSVRYQTHRPVEHIVIRDETKAGCALTMNAAANKARGEWLLPLADDDLLLPGGVAALVAAANESGADIVYPVPIVWGEPSDQFCGEPPGIPSLALIRAETWRTVGGYNNELGNREDRDLWERMKQQSKTFHRHTESPTWIYRFHGANKSRQ